MKYILKLMEILFAKQAFLWSKKKNPLKTVTEKQNLVKHLL